MNEPRVRKIHLVTECVHEAGGRALDRVHRCGSVAAVVHNPFVGSFADESAIQHWMQALGPLGTELAAELRDALVAAGDTIEGYGKGAIVGVAGELEIAAAWHVPGGAGLREALGGPKAMVPSSKKVGVLGCQLDVPLVHLHASYLRSHYDVQPVVVPDAPRPDEVVYVLVMTTGERPHHRIGGFTIDEIAGDDGLR